MTTSERSKRTYIIALIGFLTGSAGVTLSISQNFDVTRLLDPPPKVQEKSAPSASEGRLDKLLRKGKQLTKKLVNLVSDEPEDIPANPIWLRVAVVLLALLALILGLVAIFQEPQGELLNLLARAGPALAVVAIFSNFLMIAVACVVVLLVLATVVDT